MSSLRIVFAGTPTFASVALQELLAASYSVIAVYTQPDRPKGRGLKLTPSPVKELALAHELPLYQPVSLKTQEAQAELLALKPDVMVVAAYGLILPAAVLSIPTYGCINIHPSLLPKFRGAAPIERTIESGDVETGVTIMQMDVGLDTGPMLLQKTYQVATHETAGSLHDKLSVMGAKALLYTLDLLEAGKLAVTPQGDGATYANKITKEEAFLSFHHDAMTLERKVRAFNPRPVAHVIWRGNHLRIWQAIALQVHTNAAPGTLLAASEDGLDIACSDQVLRLLSVQLPGGKPLSVRDFYHAHQHELKVGTLFA